MRPINEVLGGVPDDDNPFADRTASGGVDFGDDWLHQGDEKEEGELQEEKQPAGAPAPPRGPPSQPLVLPTSHPEYAAYRDKARNWSDGKGDEFTLVQYLSGRRWRMLQHVHPQLQYPPDAYKEYEMYSADDLEALFEEDDAFIRSDCDHMRFPIGTKDLDTVTGPFVRLANVPETGTSPFGPKFLLLTRDPAVACELRDERKSRLIHILQTQEDRGVIGHSVPNVLSKTLKNMAAADFIACLLGAGIDSLWFMNFGMKARDLDTKAFIKLELAIQKEWEVKDRQARSYEDPNAMAPRNTVCDISADFCPNPDEIILCGKFDLRTSGFAPRKRAGRRAQAVSLEVHKMLTGLSDIPLGSSNFKSPSDGLPRGLGEMRHKVTGGIIYQPLVKHAKASTSSAFGAPKTTKGLKKLVCQLYLAVEELTKKDVFDSLGGIRVELRVEGCSLPSDAWALVHNTLPQFHAGDVLERIGQEKDGFVPLYGVPVLEWLGNVMKMVKALESLCQGRDADALPLWKRKAAADCITALGISTRETERLCLDPVKGLTNTNASPQQMPWFWSSPDAGVNLNPASGGGPPTPSRRPREAGSTPPSRRSPRLSERGALAAHLTDERARSNLPRGGDVQLDEAAIKARNLKEMRTWVKWYTNKRSRNADARQYYRKGNRGCSGREMSVNEACKKIWEEFGADWKDNVIPRGAGDPVNIPEGH